MTNPLRLLSGVNHADTALLTVGMTASLPATNLQTDDIQEIWRGASAAGSALIVDLGAVLEIGVIGLMNTNIQPSDQINIAISNTDPAGTTGEVYLAGLHAAGVDPVWRKYLHFVEPSVLGRYIRISITISQGPATAGRLVVAPTWAPSRDMTFGRERLWRDFSTRSRSLGGNEFIDVKPRQRGWRAAIRGLTETEAQQQVDELNRLRGIGRDVLMCIDKDSDNLGRDTVWGLLEEPIRQRQWSENRDLYEIEIELYDRV